MTLFEWLENIWNGIKDFFGFFASVKKYIDFVFDSVKAGLSGISDVYQLYPLPSVVITMCISATLIYIVLRVVNRSK